MINPMEFKTKQINRVVERYMASYYASDFDTGVKIKDEFIRLLGEWTPTEVAQMLFAEKLHEKFQFMVEMFAESWGKHIGWAIFYIADPSELEEMEEDGIDTSYPENEITPGEKLKYHELWSSHICTG